MAITINLYSFTKRENSTKQPVSASLSVQGVMLENTSLMNPVFKLSLAANPIGCNYAFVSDFQRYYFITDISTHQNFWYISCTCDVLATYKTEIGSGSHYILRSASLWDGYISDTYYLTKTKETGDKNNQTGNDPLKWSTAHSFVLGVISMTPATDKSSQVGSVVYYHMDASTLWTYFEFLMDPDHQSAGTKGVDSWSGINTSEYSTGVQQALLNPMQYIVTCMCIPVPPPGSLVVNKINFGYYTVTIDAGKMDVICVNDDPTHTTDTYFMVNEAFTVTVPKHPDAATRGAYLNAAPFAKYTLHFGPFGDIELDPNAIVDATTVSGLLKMDIISGVGRLMVVPTGNTDDVLYNGTQKISVDLNISQLSKNNMESSREYWSHMVGAMGAATNLPSGLFSMQSEVMAMSNTAAARNFPNVSGSGSTGSFLPYFDDENIYITAKFMDIADENLAEAGRPLYQIKQINTLSGYILCQDADCQITGTQEEAQKVNSYMNSGFFYE